MLFRSTFGGNPLACAAGNAVMDIILKPGFLKNIRETGLYLKEQLQQLTEIYPDVYAEVRGKGLLLGLKGTIPVNEIQNAALEQNLLTVLAGNNVIRIIPPLIITKEECQDGIHRLRNAAEQLRKNLKSVQ